MDAYILDSRRTSATLPPGAALTFAPEARPTETLRTVFYDSHPESDRTLRMDMGGLCHLCGRKAARRVEMFTPLWKAGPIMYGECCLPRAEAALLPEPLTRYRQAAEGSEALPGSVSRTLWLTFAATAGFGVLALGLERLLQTGLTPF